MLDRQPEDPSGAALDAARRRFDELNSELELKTRSMLERSIADRELHPRLMNTLSMLEHMGSHKIMATQTGRRIDQPTLRHLTEECRHAFFMKRQAEKAAGRALDYSPDALLAPHGARMYFQRLEATLERRLAAEQSADATYLYTSMIVELRAIWFYGLYQRSLDRHSYPLSLKRLLGEEQNHLTEMVERLQHHGELSASRIDAFVAIESGLYRRLLDSLQRSIN